MQQVEPDYQSLKKRLLALMDSADRNALTGHPDGGYSSPGLDLVLALRLWCHSLFRAIRLLLESDAAAEAQLLFRTLLTDAAYLVYIRHHADKLDDLATSWVYGPLEEEIGLVKDFISTPGLADSEKRGAADALTHLERQRSDLVLSQTEGKKPKPLSEGKELTAHLGDIHAYGWFKIASGYSVRGRDHGHAQGSTFRDGR